MDVITYAQCKIKVQTDYGEIGKIISKVPKVKVQKAHNHGKGTYNSSDLYYSTQCLEISNQTKRGSNTFVITR